MTIAGGARKFLQWEAQLFAHLRISVGKAADGSGGPRFRRREAPRNRLMLCSEGMSVWYRNLPLGAHDVLCVVTRFTPSKA